MTINNALFAIIGFVVLLSLAFGASISPFFYNENWLYVTTFVGFMSLQSAFTGFCPMVFILKKLGLKD
ncbi:Rhodanese-related sulfurtransferase [hydrothermal vent metagenome]|uniref:Rhodanese-related sulfurtransferase n=1 Tax=hydrothermal vent metagenome TaxID=652676 RepID=A0A1W1CH57_9ZZZZ